MWSHVFFLGGGHGVYHIITNTRYYQNNQSESTAVNKVNSIERKGGKGTGGKEGEKKWSSRTSSILL